ncbi:MAG: ATP-binding protein, partial [Acidobacteriota bacterium]|nr:ATP-binding protein [Acidobacteriota bacterium]
MTTDFLTGTVKGPGELPHEYLFITKDNKRTRIGEFVYYTAQDGEQRRQIIGTIKGRKLVRNLPDAFLSDPNTPPSLVSSLIGLNGDACEIYEIQVETIGFFDKSVNDFNNPRIPPNPGDAIYLASSETLAQMLSAKKMAEI